MARLCRWITQRLHVGRQIEGHTRSCCVGWTVLPRTRMYTVFAGRTRSFVGRTCLLSVAILWLWPGCGRDDRRGMRSDARRERSDDMRCPNCGCEVAGDRLYCPFCGVSMGGAVDLGQGETTSWDGVAATAGSGDAVDGTGVVGPSSQVDRESTAQAHGTAQSHVAAEQNAFTAEVLGGPPAPQGMNAGPQWAADVTGPVAGSTFGSAVQRRPGASLPVAGVIGIAVACLLLGGAIGFALDEGRIRDLSEDELRSGYGLVRIVDLEGMSPEDLLENYDLVRFDDVKDILDATAGGPPSSGGGDSSGALAGDVSSNWEDMEFAFEGKKFRLNTSALRDIEDTTGWKVDLSGYPSGFIVNAGQTIANIRLFKAGAGAAGSSLYYLTVSVTNPGSDVCGVEDCTLVGISLSGTPKEDAPSLVVSGGISFGMADADAAIKAIGSGPNNQSSGEGYRSLTWTSGDYRKSLGLSFNKNADWRLSNIRLAIHR